MKTISSAIYTSKQLWHQERKEIKHKTIQQLTKPWCV